MTSPFDSPVIMFVAVAFVVWLLYQLYVWVDESDFRAYVRNWCKETVKNDDLALTDAGVEAMTDYICKKMEGRSDRWECELYISPSVYRRIANEYSKRKEW